MEKELSGYKRGYLKEDFIYFHLKDKKSMEFELHYHDFNKIIITLSGKVTYLVEGKSYNLKPWDILFVSSNQVHKAIIASEEVYERIIIWVNPQFIEKHNRSDCNLLTCFELTLLQKFNMLRLTKEPLNQLKHTLNQLEVACKSNEFGSQILKNSLFLQLLVHLNRLMLRSSDWVIKDQIYYDKNIEDILSYINENIRENMSVDSIADKFYINRHYLMHKFKKETGYTIHNYIVQKKIALASSLIIQGVSIMEVCETCGFNDYSSFVRAYKKQYGLPPKKHFSLLKSLEEEYKSRHII
ncbi:AraC family transcriptional regulator [Clostridium omnivorum]|uniref:AraC family transcriptional regulator n=1 Tax=Clostridium omnivorum TaxID=1604902 RepID=A0ABQ5N8I2_9CLOT|nr:AraC family transcriptional regulator [Clostridium sp. E14]GLC31557.1 AraC family transcriptional regulator [Clostridium sp. E14]